ncbi:hypothetical protein Tco_0889118 [Tanacetum coccineum]
MSHPNVTVSLLPDFVGVTDWYQNPSIMAAPPSPNHIFDFPADEPHDFENTDLEFEEDPQEEFEGDPKEDPEEEPEGEEELEEEPEEAQEMDVGIRMDWDDEMNENE